MSTAPLDFEVEFILQLELEVQQSWGTEILTLPNSWITDGVEDMVSKGKKVMQTKIKHKTKPSQTSDTYIKVLVLSRDL